MTVPSKYATLSNGALIGKRAGARAGTTVWHWKMAIPHVELPRDARRGRVRPRRPRGRRGAALRARAEGAGRGGRAVPRAHGRHGEGVLREVRRRLPVREVRAGRRRRLHLRRHGEHDGDDADRVRALRRARGARLRRRRPRRPRARPPVVGRPAHLPRLEPRVAQRGLRHVVRGGLPRAPARQGRGAPARLRGREALHGRGRRRVPPPDRQQGLRGADRHLRPPPLREGRLGAAHAARRARRGAVLEVDPALRAVEPGPARRDRGPAPRGRGGDGAQPRVVLRPVDLRRGASRGEGFLVVRRRPEGRGRRSSSRRRPATR